MESAPTPTHLPPHAIVMQMATGAWVSRIISDLSRLGVPDIVKQHGPQTAAQMVTNGIVANPEFLERVLRAAASFGFFTESADGHFGSTDLSDAIASDTPGSVKAMVELVSGPAYQVWGGLKNAIQTGENQARAQLGMDFWDYLHANPKELEEFGEAMKSNSSASMKGVLETCDLSGATKIADIAGGFGHLVMALLEKYPNLQGVLMDRPETIPVAREKNPAAPAIASRLEYVAGDMFQSVPAADVYIMKHIMHDWNDDQCVQILTNCVAKMDGNGRLICVDAVLPPMGDTSATPAKLMDVNMLVVIPGKERTQAQWEDLYRRAGLRITSITPTGDNFGTSLVEGAKA